MAKSVKTDESKSELETINIGIVGHIDHGKTTLLYKLSGKWTDTHSEELKRGITIKLGYADATISKDSDYNINNIIIVQNKIDLVSKEKAIENYNLIKKEFKGTIAENAIIIPVSSQQEINIERIYEALCNVEAPERNTEDKPLFLVARSFDINKPGTKPSSLHGTVMGGTLKSGRLKIGDKIEIKPGIMTKE